MRLIRPNHYRPGNFFAEVDRLLSEAFQRPLGGSNLDGRHGFSVYEADDAWSLRADLPGYSREEVAVRVHEGLLSLDADPGADEEPFRSEIRWRLPLPEDVDSTAIEARLENGVLELRLPKTTPAEPETLNIEIK